MGRSSSPNGSALCHLCCQAHHAVRAFLYVEKAFQTGCLNKIFVVLHESTRHGDFGFREFATNLHMAYTQ